MKSKFYLVLFFLGPLFFLSCNAQDYYGLHVINTPKEYLESIELDESKALVDLEKCIPDLVLDIRYATANNFTKEVIYEKPKAYVRKPVAEALKKVQQELKKQNIGLKIFDAYRPYAATFRFYEVYPDTTFVAAPWKGSRHNRACAVDVSLVDLNTMQELKMPTVFDDFSEKAAPNYPHLSEEVIKNRSILIEAMKKCGFTVYASEWWHFDYQGWEKYELMDLSFAELENL